MGLIEGFVTYDAGIGKVLSDFESLGVFAYILPFILIFAVVYAILDKIPIFAGKKGINMVIALAVGLLALQFNVVAVFFGEIFPRAGIGLSVVIVALVLAGAFIDWSDGSKWIFFGIGGLAFIIVTISSLSAYYSGGAGGWWDTYGSAVIILLIVIGLVVAVMVSRSGNGGSKGKSGGSS